MIQTIDCKNAQPPQGVLQAFASQVRSAPAAIAVRTDSTIITYGELDRQAQHLAQALRSAGVGLETRVGICARRSPDMVVMLLAVLKAGGAYVPLDPDYPVERLAFIASDAGCLLVLTQPDLIELCEVFAVPVQTLAGDDRSAGGVDTQGPAFQDTARPSNALAYVIYTSGSTGKPKGAMIEDGALFNHMRWMQDRFPLGPADRVLQKTAFGFDASVWEFWAPLMAGAELVLARPDGHRDSAYLVDAVAQFGITRLQLVPSMLRAMLEEERFAIGTLSHVFCGGEALPSDLVRAFASFGTAPLINLYGPSETTIDASYWVCDPDELAVIAPIGTPIDGISLQILDDAMERVALGEDGELYIGGAGLGRGYIGQPARTAESFLPDSWTGGRLYRTGDRARQRADGAYEFLGRGDDQIKIRGQRVELSEIEAALLADPAVTRAAVIFEQERLVAFASGALAEADETRLRLLLARSLPDAMVPERVKILHTLPLLPNGKTNRRALKELAMPAPQAFSRAPANAEETTIVAICAELLGRAVDVEENLFEAGMNSLTATRLAARLRRMFRVDLPLATIFDSPRVALLAALLRSHALRHDDGATLQRRQSTDPAPLSFAQERVWFVQQMAPNNRAYAFRTVIRLQGPLNVTALEHVLTEIVRRHEIFRTSFPSHGMQPVQLVHAPFDVSLPVHDIQELGEPARRKLLDDEFRRGFDLSQLPLIRWTLLRVGENEHLLAQVEHHLVHDGWSFNVYLRELVELYAAFSEGHPSPLQELAFQFSDIAAWQRDWIARSDIVARQLAFWKQALNGAPPLLALDVGRSRPAEASFEGGLHRITVAPATARALRARCQASGVTLFMGMLALFKVVLHRHSLSDDIVVGTGVANRRLAESEDVMGMILNTLALRTRLDGNPSFDDVLRRVRATTLDAFANQDVPFEYVVEALQPKRDLRYNPLAQIMFSFHDAPLARLQSGGLRMQVNDLMDNGSAKFDLSLIVIPRLEQAVDRCGADADESITVIWEFNTDLFDRADVERLAAEYTALASELVAHPAAPLTAFASPAEQHVTVRAAALPGSHIDLPAHYVIARDALGPDRSPWDVLHEAVPAPWGGADKANRAASRSFWQRWLDAGDTPLDLPTDHARPASLPRSREAVVMSLPAATVDALSSATGCTPYVSVLAAFSALLCRCGAAVGSAIALPLSVSDDVARGAPWSMNTDMLLLRPETSRAEPFGALARRLAARLEAASRHDAVSFPELLAMSGAHGKSHHPFAQAAFSLRRPDRADASPCVWSAPAAGHGADPEQLDLHCVAEIAESSVELTLNFNAALFDRQTARSLANSLAALIASAASGDEDYTVAQLALLTEADNRDVATRLRVADARRDAPGAMLAHERFALHAARSPDAVALRYQGEPMHYAELHARAVRLARTLRRHGVGTDSLVPLYCARSPRMVVGMLAIAMAGGATVPIDVSWPRERVAYILDDTKARLVMADGGLAAFLPAGGAAILSLDTATDGDDASDDDMALPRVHPNDLAYVIYTSGTTGMPKGVAVEHRNLANFIDWFVREYDVTPGCEVAVHSPLSFDLTVSTLWGPLVSGGTARLFVEGDVEMLMASFADAVGLHLVKLTPAHLDMLRDTLSAPQCRALARVVIAAGEAFPAASARFWREAAPDSRLVNFYGPTETTVGCTVHDIAGPIDPISSVPIGTGMAGACVVLLDEDFRPVPTGVIGEICIGGPGVSRGYLNRPELDAARFIRSPLAPEVRLYRSGDYGRIRFDGALDYLGRIDGQVKLRGFRIELGEVEAVFLRLPGVQDVAVLVIGEAEQRALGAFVVRSSGAPANATALLRGAAEWLPPYMRPSTVTFVSALPLTSNGKVDRRILLSGLTAEAVVQAPVSVPPATPTEQAVAAVWSELLGRTLIARTDDFFAIGGNSLLAVRIVGRLRDRFMIDLAIRDCFEHGTIEALASRIDTLLWLRPSDAAPDASTTLREEIEL